MGRPEVGTRGVFGCRTGLEQELLSEKILPMVEELQRAVAHFLSVRDIVGDLLAEPLHTLAVHLGPRWVSLGMPVQDVGLG